MGDNSHMEVLNSALLGVVGSLLRKLHELQSTTEDGARQLSEDLGSIRTKLEKLSEVHDPTHTLSYWMKHARELFYDMEDFVDNQSDEASGADRINQLISRFKTRVDELKEKYTMYNFEDFLDQTTNTLASHRLSVVHGREHHPVVLVGIDGPANHILQWLKPKGGDSEKQLKVGSIHGVDGVGKSTLAQAVWRKLLESDFDCRAFIQTAKKPDMRMILTNILSQVRPERAPGKFQVQNLIQDIREHLHNKRYFIVIDDIWTVSVWDVLRHAFPDSNCSSRIIITTTAEDIALACCSYDDEYIFRMKPLSGDDSKRTFISTAFGPGNGCPPQVNDNLDEITRKCGGLPLALTCLASVVASLPKTEQLEYFKFLRTNLRTNSSAMEVLNFVLKLCYNSLHHSLKTCLLYLSVYPMSYAMLKEDLVKQWIAEGFICSLDGKDIEEVAMSYFDMLVNLNLIQQMDISNHYKKRVSYRVHPVVYYFITCNSLKDNFISVIDYTQSTVVLTDKIRRLALHFGSATAPAKTGLSQVRSFAFMGLVSCMPSLVEFKLVRVVILHFQGDHRVRKFSLTKIRELLLLRYLHVRSSVTTVILPDQVQCLKHLETLEINAVVAAVPLDIVNHPSLKHVRVGRKMKHNRLSMGLETSGEAVFEKVSCIISSASLQKLELLPPICSFSRLPAWVQELHGLRILEIVVRELDMNDMEYLSDIQFLTALTLYVRKPTPGRTVTLRAGAFPVLKYLKVVSGVVLLRFQEKAVCNLEKLKIGFNTHRGENFGEMLGGIHHLLKLKFFVASIGKAVESDMIAAESALRDAISKHTCPPSFKVKWVEPFDDERNPLEIQIWSQEAESSSKQICSPTVKKDNEIQEEDPSIGLPEILPRKVPTEDSRGSTARVPPDVLAVVGSLLRKLDELPSTEDDGPRQLSEDLGSIKTKLENLSEVQDPPVTVSYWMKDARELSYDMEDSIDQFVLASGADTETDKVNQLVSGFKTGVDDLIERYNKYNLQYVLIQTTNTLASYRPVVHGREPHPVFLIGINGPANEILQWLIPKGDDRGKQHKVVTIHGVEGVGKSTLAHKLWHELEGDFECRAFIQTSKKPDMRMILTNILSQVRPERPPDIFQDRNLIQDIRKHLQDKRYFIVIQDLWTVSIWNVLRRAFPDSNHFSRIIITTTAEDIAMECCSYDPEYIFRMKPLTSNDSKRLFISTAFGHGNGCPPQVNDNFLDEITRKCGCLPLALVCLAAVVASLPEKEQQILEYLNFLCNNLRTNSTGMEVLNEVLELCYNFLPHSLQTCLLYLSVYPMSYTILKEDLVKQWIAEGFICALDGKDIEEVARSYFDELVNLNLIQQLHISNRDKKRVSYRVHPVVYYFITCNSLKDNFITVIDYTQSTVVLTDKIRRLALHFGSATYATTPASAGLSQVRSFAFMGLMSCMPSVVDFKLVRVIILHFHDDHGDKAFSLTEISKLLLLRYLQVRSSVTVVLPDQVQCLKHLETLEINAVVATVPSDIVNHPSLKHVRLGRKMKHNHLNMGPDTSGEAVFEKVSGIISSASLQKLELMPPICSFSWLPPWVEKLHGLRILEIVVRELGMHDPEFLSELPFLTALTLYVRKPTAGRTTVTFRGGAFPVLKYLKLVSGVLLLNFREKAVCKLEKLKIGFNTHGGENFGQMLGGTHHLLKLQVIVASIGAAVESDMIAVESALREAISKHPCPPSFKVKRVEKPFDEECDPLEMQISCKDAESPSEQIRYPTVEMKHSEIQEEDSSIGQSEILPRKLPTEDTMGIPALAEGPRTSSAAAYQEPRIEIGIRSAPTGQTETMLGVLTSMMDSLLGKLRGLLELDHALPSDVHVDIKLIHLRLKDMQKELYRLCSVEWQSKDWFKDCRELALDIEDFVDLCTLWIDTTAASSKNETFFSQDEILRNLENLKQRVVEQVDWLRRLCESGSSSRHSVTFGSGIFVPYMITNKEFVGMDGPLEEVSKMVMEDKAECKIISIVGMAGSGKTTLAGEVYRKLGPQGYFQLSAFISGGQKLDMFIETLKDMLLRFDNKRQGRDSHEYDSDIDSDVCDNDIDSDVCDNDIDSDKCDNVIDSHEHDHLIGRLRELLENKRYLIVVDDLWSMEQWQTIRRCFPENNLGSRIIITTRNTEVARRSFGFSHSVYKIGLLSDTDSESLFLSRVFGTEQGCPKHLEAVAAQIIRRCGGLPLALISTASSLKNSPPTQEEWERHSLNFLSSSDGKYMMQILSLSYNDLLPDLKTCMLYLSIFPEHHEVDTERLMRLWSAEGFIKTGGMSAEEIAISFLMELIRINMIQPLHPKHNGIPRYCRVHPVMHDFIVYRALEQNFVTLVDDRRQDVPTNNGPVRRLSHQRSSNRDQDGTQIDLSHTRSITVFGQANAAPLLTSQLRVVRVLDLEGCGGPVCLDALHDLVLLKYLSLRGTDVSELPESIGELRCLETLDVRSTNVKELPDSMVRLEKLMHLLAGSAKLPNRISKMKALQTLSCAIVPNAWARMVKELGKLEDLRELGLLSCDLTEEEPGDGKHVKFPDFGFGSLRQLCIQGRLQSMTFEPYSLPMVETLELKFTGSSTEKSDGIFGVENLWSLEHVLLEFSQDDDSVMAIVDTVRKAAANPAGHHFSPPAEVTVIVDGRPLDLDPVGEEKSRPLD